MKLNKHLEEEVLAAYKVYFDGYVNGDVSSMMALLADDYNQIGSAEAEVFFNKKDAAKFIYDTIDQIAGKTEIRNRSIKIDPLDQYILVTDLFDIYALMDDEWSFYSKFRASTLMQHSQVGWKFVHQHSSLPDARTEEGENIATEKISAENLQLREAVKRRTVELEHKNKELEIEAALERVRSKTMAMHNSSDVGDTVVTLFDEVLKLGIDKTIRCGIGILEGFEHHMETRSATSHANGEVDFKMGMLDMRIHPMLIGLKKAWKKGDKGYCYYYDKKDVYIYYEALNNEPEYPFHIDLNTLPEEEYHNSFFFKEGILFAFTSNPMSEEVSQILSRFANVFGQTYRRYLDLRKAEAQAREAQIETALEKVRSRSLAMHKSEELKDVASTLFDRMSDLDIEINSSSIFLFSENSDAFDVWVGMKADIRYATNSFHVPRTYHPVFKEINGAIKNREQMFEQSLNVEEKNKLWKHLFENSDFKYIPEDRKKVILEADCYNIALACNKYTGIQLVRYHNQLYSKSDKEILIRFAKVFEQTYTRFLDLKKAEEQAREAVKQASLERIRGQIASMRTTQDLQRITPLIWKELKVLEVPFFRCGVFIVNEKEEKVNVYLTTPDGKPLAALNLAFNSNHLTKNAIENWRNKEVYQEHWTREEFVEWINQMMKLRQVKSKEEYQGSSNPPESLHLHFIPFAQGMLYIGNVDQLEYTQINLVKYIAEAFSFAYSRYEDFVFMENAKMELERTLSDLKEAQSQLIHSEKMASLGELTAGIAHEIQNPLNFVNNFSEVNKELITELTEEIDNGELDEAKAIIYDITGNEEKINYHGKRADAIVKGMLQHSRSGKGEKVATDINELADEYLRLAYHGLRAKDKSFNADFKLEADKSIHEIDLVPQDFGRVLLNLINNAFHAVTEKSKAVGGDYKPEVVVSTSKTNECVELSVKDNGSGIPDDIINKIFQPFFTTKPTGEGTGLGLSLSYDIITKGHGGELLVETKNGVGTEFIIRLKNQN